MMWSIEKIKEKLMEVEQKGFIGIPENMYRRDDGIVGQILEREFGIVENNLRVGDLGKFELKGMRWKKSKPNMLTLFHKTSASGLTPIQIFDRFGYVKKSKRSDIMKKKLFTTIRGDKYNNLGFILKANGEDKIELYHREKDSMSNEYIATWDLSEAKKKIGQMILVFADNKGTVNSREEQFHFTKAYLLDNIMCLSDAINAGAVVMDLCIDKPIDSLKAPHDRGPHIRIPIKKLEYLYGRREVLL